MSVRQEIEAIRLKHGGLLSEEVVVNEAASESHPLHKRFTWDDSEAGKFWRLEEARILIRSVYVTFESKGEGFIAVRAYASLPTDRMDGGGYRAINDIMSNREMRKELLATAIFDLEAFQRRFSNLQELVPIFVALDAVKNRQAKAAVRKQRPKTARPRSSVTA